MNGILSVSLFCEVCIQVAFLVACVVFLPLFHNWGKLIS